jgi:glycosyltransferase involved in cell wall biosynthesis
MNVVHIITRLIVGGAQENTLHTVEDQQRIYGDEVTLLTGPGLGPEGSLEEQAKCRGLNLRIIPELRREINPWRDWRSFRQLLRQLREINPHIVHTHSSKAGILGRLAARRLNIPAVHTIHGNNLHRKQNSMRRWFYRRAEQWAARRTAKLISVCDALTDEYVVCGVAPRERFVTIYSGMDVDRFLTPRRPPHEVRAELGFGPEHTVIATFARMFHQKGHDHLLRAAPAVVRFQPSARFLLVGSGILRPHIEQEIARLGLQDRFVLTGLVSPEGVPDLIHATDIVVDMSDWGGIARVLPQALLAGKPVVASDVEGAREVALPSQTGCLLPSGDVDGLVAALVQLAGDPALRTRLGQNGRELCREVFRHETMTRRIREVYQALLSPGTK